MDYREFWQEENESVRERYELSVERLRLIRTEETVPEPFRAYFKAAAEFMTFAAEMYEMNDMGAFRNWSIGRLKQINDMLYHDILPANYDTSYANPSYAAAQLGEDYGKLLSYLLSEIRGQIVFAHECRLTELTILNELFIEIYNMFEEEELPAPERIRETIYWFISDYTDLTAEYRLREQVDPELPFAKDIVTGADLSDLRYLYFYGEYVSEEELKIARFMNSLPQETVDCMADTYTEGYRKGFTVMNVDLSKKKSVAVVYELGYERMVKKAIENFTAMGLDVIIYRGGVWSMDRLGGRRAGYHGTSPNRQYDYDHRFDSAVYYRKAYTDRKQAVLGAVYETYKKQCADYAGPAVIETFGEAGFEPVNRPEAWTLTEKQEKLKVAAAGAAALLREKYIPSDETSFTIIAFPKPSIGPDFEEIFAETIRINTLDYELYRKIQQNIVDRLDQAEHVIVTGVGDNHTHMKVMLHQLSDPTAQTNFENCVADVNIPLGEVFTSPVLTGTEGVLEVGSVYIGEFQFKNLHMEFKDGKITDYSCSNFDDPAENKKLIKQMILQNHDTLPIGEFAVGTNTAAYAMARRFGIIDRLPILIVEKMGPHFAVGDTCYSRAEDSPMYNPDGKEVIARENECSALRHTEPEKAYFNCHTDITIPYPEIGEIYGVTAAGEKLPIISGGRFVVPGTEILNEALGVVLTDGKK